VVLWSLRLRARRFWLRPEAALGDSCDSLFHKAATACSAHRSPPRRDHSCLEDVTIFPAFSPASGTAAKAQNKG
jgi:hypothetical protein